MERTTIEIQMTDEDFILLTHNSGTWRLMKSQSGRFIPLRKGETVVKWSFERFYCFETYADVLIAGAYLRAKGFEYQVLSDEDARPNYPYGYIIATNFTAGTASPEPQ